jgi:hypothetical protein
MRNIWRRKNRSPSAPSSFSFSEDLPTTEVDLSLRAHFQVLWQHIPASSCHHDPEAALRDYVRAHAKRVSEKEPITRFYAISDSINTALGVSQDLETASVRLLWASVLVEPGQMLNYAVERERIRSEVQLRVEQQKDEIRHIEAFRSRVLSDPGMALAYWFVKNPGDIRKDTYAQVENISRTISLYDPDKSWIQVAKVIQEFVHELTRDERRQSLDTLREWFLRYGMSKYADRLPEDLDDLKGDAPD